MSFKSRQKKREARIAQAKRQREQRSKYADRYYLTIVNRACCCNHGGERLRRGDECVFRFEPKAILWPQLRHVARDQVPAVAAVGAAQHKVQGRQADATVANRVVRRQWKVRRIEAADS